MRLFLPALLMICYLGVIIAQPASELLEKIKKLKEAGVVVYANNYHWKTDIINILKNTIIAKLNIKISYNYAFWPTYS